MRSSCLALVLLAVTAAAPGAPIIMNEYNAVDNNEYLKNNNSDTYWGRVPGNGKDWFEMVVIQDHLDMRGWKIRIYENGSLATTLTFTQHALWQDLRAGTIITVSEELADDVSFDPLGQQGPEDWWINVQAANGASGTYISASNFPVSKDNSQFTILNSLNQVMFGPAGEGVKPTSGVGSDEVWKLEENPSDLITPLSNYKDGSSSTFGSPNIWDQGGFVQDFSALRSWVPEPASLLMLALGSLLAIHRRR